MEPEIFCKNCGKITSNNISYCQECGSELSLVKKSPSPFQELSPPLEGQEQTNIPKVSASSPTKGILEPGVNFIYFVFTLGIFAAILTTTGEMITNQGLESLFSWSLNNEFRNEHLILLLGLILLLDLSLLRAWAVLQLYPVLKLYPGQYPESYETPRLIIGLFILPIFLVIIPYMVLGLGISLLIAVITLVWSFFDPNQYKKRALKMQVHREKADERLSTFAEGSQGTQYTIEISEERGSSFWGTGLQRVVCFIVRDQMDQVCFKLVGGPARYTIYNAQNIELGELKDAGNTLTLPRGTIIEKETGFETSFNFGRKKFSPFPEFRKPLSLSVTTPFGQYFLSDRIVSDQAFKYILSDSQTRQVLSFERPRYSGKGNIWGIVQNFGHFQPFLACAIGVLLGLSPIFTMNSIVRLLDKSTEIKLERTGKDLREFIFKDDTDREIFRGKKRGSSYVFTDPSGTTLGEVTRKPRSAEWVISDFQRDITGTLDLSDIMIAGRGEKASNRLVVGNETFSFGNFMGFIRELYDGHDKLSFAIFGYQTSFTLDIKRSLTPNFWCFLSVCLVMECYEKNYRILSIRP